MGSSLIESLRVAQIGPDALLDIFHDLLQVRLVVIDPLVHKIGDAHVTDFRMMTAALKVGGLQPTHEREALLTHGLKLVKQGVYIPRAVISFARNRHLIPQLQFWLVAREQGTDAPN